MIKQIELQNFQSHEHTKIALGHNTVLTGKSSSGKTAVIRGLEWLFYGEWDDGYPMYDDKPTAVSVDLDDGTRIIRMRKGKENLAAVIKDGKTLKYKSFGNIIPGIFDMINVRPVKMGKEEININLSVQNDPRPFLISYSKPARAQWLGRLYGAHILNGMLREMNKDRRAADSSSRTLERDAVDHQERLKDYESVRDQATRLEKAKASMARADILSEISQDAVACQHLDDKLLSMRWLESFNLKALRDGAIRLKGLIEIQDDVVACEHLDGSISRMRWLETFDFKALRDKVRHLRELEEIKEAGSFVQEDAQRLENGRWLLEADLKTLRGMVTRFGILREFSTDFDSLSDRAKSLLVTREYNSAALKTLNGYVQKHAHKGGKCPICASKKKISAETLAKNLRLLIGGSDAH